MSYPVEVHLTRTQRAIVKIDVPSSLVAGEEDVRQFPEEEARIRDLIASTLTASELFEAGGRCYVDEGTVAIEAMYALNYGPYDLTLDVSAMREWEV